MARFSLPAASTLAADLSDLAAACLTQDLDRVDAGFHAVQERVLHLEDNEIDIGIDLLLNQGREESLMRTLSTMKSFPTPFDIVRGSIVDLIMKTYEAYGSRAFSTYIGSIIDLGVILFRSERSYKVRISVLQLIMALVQDAQLADSMRLLVPTIAATLMDEARAWSKLKSDAGGGFMVLEAFGVISSCYASEMTTDLVKFLAITFTKHLMSPSNLVVEGALRGLPGFLSSFSEQFSDFENVFQVICAILSAEHTRYGLPLAALGLLGRQSERFRHLLILHVTTIITLLQSCISHRNRDLSHQGLETFESVIYEISNAISDSDDLAMQSVYSFVIGKLMAMLPSYSSDAAAITAAVRGLGLFSGAIHARKQESELRKCIGEILEWWKSAYVATDDRDIDARTSLFAPYISSVAMMVQYVPDLDNSSIASLQSMLVRMFAVFPSMYAKRRDTSCMAILQLTVVCFQSVTLIDRIFSSTILQALSLSLNVLRKPSGRQEYEDYVDIWKAWLASVSTAWQRGLRPQLTKDVVAARRHIYSMLIGSLIKILSLLDITICEGDDDSVALSNPNDFAIFLNLVGQLDANPSAAELDDQVDFCLSFIPKVQAAWFQPYADDFFNQVVPLMGSSPSVSGSLKLLRCVVSVCRDQGFSMPTALSSVVTTALTRIDNLEGELLFAHLEFILNTPQHIVSRSVLLPAITRSLQIGLLYQKFSELAVAAARHWTVDASADFHSVRTDLAPVLDHLLPYLRSDATPSPLQIQILLLIGQLGLSPETVAQAWHGDTALHRSLDVRSHLVFTLPFSAAAALPIAFDPFLPTAADLAQRSPDRQLKTSAAEFLHAVLLKCVCDDARDPQKHRESPRAPIYAKLMPVALHLAVDVDASVAAPFRTLITQLCHWFAMQSDPQGDQDLVQSQINAACDPSNAALREIGALSIAESFKWLLKFERVGAARAMLVRICALCHRRQRGQNLGAYAILSRIYRVFRERSDLVSEFALRIVRDLLVGIDMESSDDDKDAHRCAERTLNQYVKIITDAAHGKAALLVQHDAGRAVLPSLSALLRWIGGRLLQSRHQASLYMRVFDAIAAVADSAAADSVSVGGALALMPSGTHSLLRHLPLVRWALAQSDIIDDNLTDRLRQFVADCTAPDRIDAASLLAAFDVADKLSVTSVDLAIRVLFSERQNSDDLIAAARRALAGHRIGVHDVNRCTGIDLRSISVADLINKTYLACAFTKLSNTGILDDVDQTVADRLAHQLASTPLEPAWYDGARAVLGLALELGLPDATLFALLRRHESMRAVCSATVAAFLLRRDSGLIVMVSDDDIRSAVIFDGFDLVLAQLRPYKDTDRALVAAALDAFCAALPTALSDHSEDVRAQIRFLYRVGVWDTALLADRTASRMPRLLAFCSACLQSVHHAIVADTLDVLRSLFTIGGDLADSVDQTLSDAIRRLTTSAPWPLKSRDVAAGSAIDMRCAALLTKLLDILAACRRPELLQTLLGVVRECGHRQQDAIDRCMRRLVVALASPSLGPTAGLHWAAWAIGLLTDPDLDRSRRDNAHVFLVDTFLAPFLARLVRGALDVFVTQHARVIWSLKDSDNLISARSAFTLVRVLAERLRDERSIVLAAFGTDLKSACKTCADHLKKTMAPDDPELDRMHHGTAYGALCALMLSRPAPDAPSTPERLIVGLCLTETPTDPTWSKLVDRFWTPRFTIDMAFTSASIDTTISEEPQPDRSAPMRVQLSATSLSQDLLMLRQEAPLAEESLTVESSVVVNALEMDPLNALEAVPVMMRLVRELRQRFEGRGREDVPLWVRQIGSAISKGMVQSRLLALKIVLNCASTFAPYAAALFDDVVTLITSADLIGGVGFHYLLADVADMFRSDWDSVPTDSAIASRFLNHLMSVADDVGDQTQPEAKIRHHADLIRDLSRKWAPCRLSLDIGIAARLLSAASNRTVYVGLTLIELPLRIAHEQAGGAVDVPFVCDPQLSTALLRCVSHESRVVSNRAATLFGRLFECERVVDRCAEPECAERRQHVRFVVLDLANQGLASRFVAIALRIGYHYPLFIDDGLIAHLLPLAVRARGALQLDAIQALIASSSSFQNPLEVVIPVLNQTVIPNHADIDRAVLLLAVLVVPRLSKVQLQDALWPVLIRYAAHTDALARLTYYKTVIAIAATFTDTAAKSSDWTRLVRAELLNAFHDDDGDVRQLAAEFWSASASAQSPSSLLNWLLDALPIGADYIALAVFVWLSVSEQHASMREPISPVPLSDTVRYTPLVVTGTWTPAADASQTPLYVAAATAPGPALIPATPSPEFSLSQTIMSLDPSNPPLDVLIPAPDAGDNVAPTHRVRKRFGERPMYEARAAAIRRQDRVRRDAPRQLDEERERQARSVHLYRTYRDGELPDVQIPRRDLIAPLRMLYRDRSLAGLVFLHIFSAMMSRGDVDDRDAELIRLHLGQIITGAVVASPSLASIVLLAARQCCPAVNVAPADIVRLVQLNSCVESGVLLLEHQIAQSVGKKRGVDDISRRRCDRASVGALYELYESLQDADLIAALSLALVHEPGTSKAVMDMFAGSFDVAFHQFESLLSADTEEEVDEFEAELWEEGRIDALAHLGQWQPLLESVLHAIDDPVTDTTWHRLWSDQVDLFAVHPHLRVKYINYYQKSIRKLDAHHVLIADFVADADAHLLHYPAIAFDQCLCIAELGDQFKTRTAIDRALSVVVHGLHTVSMVGASCTYTLLRQLHILTELHESFSFDRAAQCAAWIGRQPQSVRIAESVFVDDLTRSRLSSLARLERHHPDWKSALQSIAFQISLEAARIYLDQSNAFQTAVFVNVARSLRPRASELLFFEFGTALIQSGAEAALKRVALDTIPDLERIDAYLMLFDRGAAHHLDVLLEQCSRDALRLVEQQPIDSGQLASRLMRCARYCQRQLLATPADKHDLADLLVDTVLVAMSLSAESSEMFPYVLDLVVARHSSRLSAKFAARIAPIPSWLLLRWVAQIIAHLATSPAIVTPLLERVAADYPHALVYPLQVPLQDWRQPNRDAKAVLKRLLRQCRLPETERFVAELNQLTYPEHQFRAWAALCATLLVQRRSDDAIASYVQFRHMCLPDHNSTATKILAAFQKQFKREIDNAFGVDGGKLVEMRPEQVEKECARIVRERIAELPHGPMPLADFSPYLTAFQFTENEYVEIPGQYGGWRCPDPASHAKILGLHPIVYCIRSLRRPKKVVTHGSDERNYTWLAKGGEDLRLDQRIQSMFTVMNSILRADPTCSQRCLAIATYAVIPMTPNVGLIEWVPNTIGLTSCVELQMGTDAVEQLHGLYRETLLKSVRISAKTALLSAHTTMVTHPNRYAALAAAYGSISGQLPPALFARIARTFCNSDVSLIEVRTKMARSYAVAAIAAYILGIGDRHLDNMLIDQTSGELLQIDFGVAFDQGLQLPIPELMPIRYTPLFQQALAPLPSGTLIYQTMVHAMLALRHNRQILLTIMEVFIREPHADWQKRLKVTDDGLGNGGDCEMFDPNKKMQFAAMKLEGFASAFIMSEELRLTSNPNKEQLAKIVEGERRNQYGDSVVSVEEQVQCLLDHSADQLILALTYEGWRPYI